MTAIVIIGTAGVALLVTLALLRLVLRTRSEPAPPTRELVGSLGTVLAPIPEKGVGEVAVTTSGHRMRLSASAQAAVAAGATVVVIDVESEDAVVVAETGF